MASLIVHHTQYSAGKWMTQKGSWTAEFIIHLVVGFGIGNAGRPEQVQWIANNFKALPQNMESA